MALVNLGGGFITPIGLGYNSQLSNVAVVNASLDAANEALIFIGQVFTSDEGSHTIDTSGSSALCWKAGTSTFANAGTTVKVGLAAVDAAVGSPGRAVNVADVITFDVSKSLVGGGGGIPSTAWQTHVPDAGTKTIAHGDFVAFAVQMTARGGADVILATYHVTGSSRLRPIATTFTGAAYAPASAIPNCIIRFADGAYGWIYGGEIASTINTRTWNSSDATKEYGQLFKLAFPTKIYGGYVWVDPDADHDLVLYEDPLGTPVAVRTVSIDANTVSAATPRRGDFLFRAAEGGPYTTTGNQVLGLALKPGASNISAFYKTIADAAHRIIDPSGVDGYGISRATGAFADANSSLDHYYMGLLCGAFDNGAGGGGTTIINSRATAHARR